MEKYRRRQENGLQAARTVMIWLSFQWFQTTGGSRKRFNVVTLNITELDIRDLDKPTEKMMKTHLLIDHQFPNLGMTILPLAIGNQKKL